MHLTELPTDILDLTFSHLDGPSLAQLSCSCQLMKRLIDDEKLWKRAVINDYHLYTMATAETFRLSGWRLLYIGLRDAHVFTWGENSDHRLGHSAVVHRGAQDVYALMSRVGVDQRQDRINMSRGLSNSRASSHRPHHISSPCELVALRGKRIIDIHAGGWSFHALDRDGYVWMWGRMHTNLGAVVSMGARHVPIPSLVRLPPNVKIQSLAAGRSHVIGVARDKSLWHWDNRWVVQRILTPVPAHDIIQVVAHTGYSSLLSKSGHIYLVREPPLVQSETAVLSDMVLTDTPVSLQTIETDVLALDRPFEYPVGPGDQFVQIAGMERCTIGLTRSGRVFKMQTDDLEQFMASPGPMTTELKHFGATRHESNDPGRKMNRFVSAQHQRFAVYTADGHVLLGHQDMDADSPPEIFDSLQQAGICKVTFGDHHYGALTNNGKLLTWGSYSSGGLGQGDSQPFYRKEAPEPILSLGTMLVFSVGFGGWHSGALAIPRSK